MRLGLPNKIAAMAGLLEGEDEADGDADSAETNMPAADEGVAEEGMDAAGGAKKEAAEASGSGGKSDGKDTSGPTDSESAKNPEEKAFLEDASEILTNTPYQWHDWCVVRSRDCLYLWNEYCVIELSNVSNGWFRFLVDSRLATMYSSGSTEGGPDSYG